MTEIAHHPAPSLPHGQGPALPRPPATIVPLQGLPIVGGVVVFLVVALASNSLWALGFLHVVGGALWTGVDLFVGFVVGPIIGGLSIPARVEFSTRFMPVMLLLMPTLVTMTLAPGWQLARHLGYLDASYPNHGWLVASYIVVGVMATIAIGCPRAREPRGPVRAAQAGAERRADRETDAALRLHRRDHRRRCRSRP